MAEHIAAQPYVAFAFLYAGIVSGLLYDLLRLMRLMLRGKLSEILFDLLFAAGLGVIMAVALLLATGGRIRLYVFLLAALGFALEQFAVFGLISRIVYRCANKKAGFR